MAKDRVTDWWFFVQPNGLFGCYDEISKEIRDYNLTRDEAIALSEDIADGDSEYDDLNLDHQGALDDAAKDGAVPIAAEAEKNATRMQVALQRDRSNYGEERIEEYVQGMMAASAKEVQKNETAWSKYLSAVGKAFGMADNPATTPANEAVSLTSKKAERLNERFRPGYHMEDIAEALSVLGDIDAGKLDSQVHPTNWVYDVGAIRMQIERNSAGKINSIVLGPLVGEQLNRLGLADFNIEKTPDGYRLKYYFITDKGRTALQQLKSGDRSMLNE